MFGRGTLHVPVEDEEQKEHGHKLGPNIHDISSMFYTQYHALCTHQKQCDISLNFTPQRCLLQRCVRLQNPKFHHLREKVFNNIPSILSGISIWLFCLKKAIDQH